MVACATTPRPLRPAALRLTVTRRTAKVSLGTPVVLRLRFSRAVTRLPVQVQRKVGKRWVKVASRRVSGRSPVVSVRLRATGLHTLRVKFPAALVRRCPRR